ncbi:MAG: hypothetical protein A2X96_02225 [Syntrophobacterales bacterium GWC2_56_13]|nr:MAG: hypothetical protein A2X96_02225 [Syntrophobacterales bacterium GWC2_56_13]OHE19600.1 MAG: hypothetical protein A2X95_09200 [Syntrophobacterales bacterium GWF2_56_9]
MLSIVFSTRFHSSKPFAKVPAGGKDQPFLSVGNAGDLFRNCLSLFCSFTALHDDDVARESGKPISKMVKMLFPFRDHDRGAFLLQGPEDVVEDQVVPLFIGDQCGVNIGDGIRRR